jgi:hypothetical protein
MSRLTREYMKGRRSRGQFLALSHAYLESPQYAALSSRALKALIDIAGQYNGRNNGDLTAAWSVMRVRGWTSKDQLAKSVRELLDRGWVMLTRKGGRDRSTPTLYAVTWWGIDDCGGKLDPGVTASAAPLNTWKNPDRSSVPSTKTRRLVKRLSRLTGQTAPCHGAKVIRLAPNQPVARGENAAVS